MYLVVDNSGARRWMLRLTIRCTGRRREYGLGSTRLVSLMDARKKALEYRAVAAIGKDPILERKLQLEKTMTFKKLAERYYEEEVLETGRNAKHKQQFINTMRTYAYPVLETVSVSDIGSRHIAEILHPIWNKKRETAKKVRQRLNALMEYAIWHQYRASDNPVSVVKFKGKTVNPKKFESLGILDLQNLMAELRERKSIGAYALRFTILTAVRSSNTRFAKWSEVGGRRLHLEHDGSYNWTIPKDKMKIQLTEDFNIRLSDEAVEILKEVSKMTPTSDYIFSSPSKANSPISDATMRKQLQEFFPTATVHGMRRTWRNWAEEFVPESSVRREAKEWCLMHQNQNRIEERYLDQTYFEERKYIMSVWGWYLDDNRSLEEQDWEYKKVAETIKAREKAYFGSL